MKRIMLILMILAILSIGISAGFAKDTLNSTDDFTEAINQAQSENKNIVLIFDQDSCVYCDILKENTLADEKVIDELNTNYILVIVNVNEEPELAAKYNVYGTPLTVILDSNQNQIGRIEGYVDADEFLEMLQGV
ncbi:MAG: thioredoxin fold domain-containing protein [Methanobrevibacter sp.]|uniref:thioredoxin family protein n=1 Tax=Methanobrevibacter sp. TaxID=66852 RepID=UPI0025DEFEDC|nr:thioredoxin fold domain-containing protein [Methanobrevibacter sp.]MBR0270620.1 thioredoxin fold domain-containing protein [Methanobrevibacter sp.]